ncbi:transcriptional repressor NrdR [Candidatus Peregrinibacteria bacterium]|nr:MAG: transcriptional repressor NrdR [Candidatus Peregrinibacteria bacterium]
MQCPRCHHSETKVIDSRPEREGRSIRRRRECEKCEFRFSTLERVITGNLIIKKRDGETEAFSAEKLEKSIRVACGKRPISRDQIREMVNELSENWAGQNEVQSSEIGEAVMNVLKKIDHIAYIRFASVYRKFKDVEEFKKEISELLP